MSDFHGHEQSVGSPQGHETQPPGNVVPIMDVADALIGELSQHSAGRTARSILSGTVIRAVVIALRADAEMGEHDSPPGATLQVLRGTVTLLAGERSWTVEAGQLVPIPPQRHSVRAHTDSAVLLTVALR